MNDKYNPDFFIPSDLQNAKEIILTQEDQTVDIRWEKETEWSLKLFDALFEADENSVILDWGCGIGRLSKTLIDRYNCKVVGVDIQQKMLDYAKDYVNSDNFTPMLYPENLLEFPKNKFTHVISVWVFQHSNNVQFEIPTIYNSLVDDAKMFVVELDKKAIPNDTGFYDDGVPTRSILEKYFHPESLGKIPLKYTSNKIQDMSWWGILKKNSAVKL
jgi:cyclopropane fatty-acyl-phospholipid synthase-like methyltransferase